MRLNKLFALLPLCAAACFSHNSSSISIESEDNSQLVHKQNNAFIRFVQNTIDLGYVPSDTTLTATFQFQNIGTDTLFIEFINPDCSCTDYTLSDSIVAPNGNGSIQLTISTKNKCGEQAIFTTISSSTKDRFNLLKIFFNVNL